MVHVIPEETKEDAGITQRREKRQWSLLLTIHDSGEA